KPTLTPAAFKARWDAHATLLKTIAGLSFPLTHTRRYIARTEGKGAWPAAMLVGTQEDFTYDGIAELVFEDKGAFETFIGVISAPEATARIAKNEDGFIVREVEGCGCWG
ncbi:hypothetical protein BU23DRAFT_366027, partial [Bimuria novae-zelandiae CBS 107.79]